MAGSSVFVPFEGSSAPLLTWIRASGGPGRTGPTAATSRRVRRASSPVSPASDAWTHSDEQAITSMIGREHTRHLSHPPNRSPATVPASSILSLRAASGSKCKSLDARVAEGGACPVMLNPAVSERLLVVYAGAQRIISAREQDAVMAGSSAPMPTMRPRKPLLALEFRLPARYAVRRLAVRWQVVVCCPSPHCRVRRRLGNMRPPLTAGSRGHACSDFRPLRSPAAADARRVRSEPLWDRCGGRSGR